MAKAEQVDSQELALAIQAFREAKADEQIALMKRLAAEQMIARLTKFDVEEGSKSYNCRHGSIKASVTLKQPVTRSVDADEIPAIKKSLTAKQFKDLFKTKYELKTKEFKALSDNEAEKETYLLVAAAVKSKPGKVGVELKSFEKVETEASDGDQS
jgi:hypothetical protein